LVEVINLHFPRDEKNKKLFIKPTSVKEIKRKKGKRKRNKLTKGNTFKLTKFASRQNLQVEPTS
jgi:hypothetical protein